MSKIHLAEEFTLEQVILKNSSSQFQVKSSTEKMSGIQLILILLAVAVNHGSIITCPASTFLQSSEITQNGGGTNFL